MSEQKILCDLEASLERRILAGLTAEWTAAVDELSPQYRRLIRLPVFALRDMGARLGRWLPDRIEISLNRRFVAESAWDAVRDVLLHEMAHQLAHELPGGREEPPHGPVFRGACRLLRADPRASGTYPTLQERIAQGAAGEDDILLMRIRKLFALAGSRNRHEAGAAMAKAHQLIRKYNIDLQNIAAGREFASCFLGCPALRHFREHYHLARLLQEYYFVEGIWVPAWVIEKARMGRVLEVSGTCANIRMAAYVFHFVNRFIDDHWIRFKDGRSLSRYRKTDFAVGVIEGFREKLNAGRMGRFPAGKADLVCISDPLLKQYLRGRYPRLRSFRRTLGNRDQALIEEGKRLGRKLVIHRGIEEHGTAIRPQLPEKT